MHSSTPYGRHKVPAPAVVTGPGQPCPNCQYPCDAARVGEFWRLLGAIDSYGPIDPLTHLRAVQRMIRAGRALTLGGAS